MCSLFCPFWVVIMTFLKTLIVFLLVAFLSACAGHSANDSGNAKSSATSSVASSRAVMPKAAQFYAGADLSYVNEMQDCGAEYRFKGTAYDPFVLFANAKTNLVRVRLWHNPHWTQYSNIRDVTKTIQRAKDAGMKVLLDFHYSDTWADPEKQFIPAAWESLHADTPALAQAMYDYTYSTLLELKSKNLLPEFVQIGNETNSEIMQLEASMNTKTINWQRNATLLNKGIKAVTDFNQQQSTQVKILLHIAQPENALVWFKQATAAGVTGFDVIGLSYYPKWSIYDLTNIGDAIAELKTTYNKDVMIVETAYPWTLEGYDQAANVLGSDSLVSGYGATPKGQYDYLMQLSSQVINAGGMGIIYWEPAWVSTSCSTLWGQGSHWENASFFYPPAGNDALEAIMFFQDAQTLYNNAP
jgi:arabinogalactan endo-1,4-beta-galactosidase